MGDATTSLTRAEARHLLRRTSFGGATSRRELDRFDGITRGEAADELLDFRPSRYEPKGRNIAIVHDKWLKLMIKSRKQLQERLVLFWHDHFATSDDVVNEAAEMAIQNRTLRQHCLGIHLRDRQRGNLKDFVKAINKDPAMMRMLDTRDNTKVLPNENYARELLELFTLGVFDAAGNPNYTEADVFQIARGFTGWRVSSDNLTYFDGGNGEVNGGISCGSNQTGRHDYAACFASRGPKVIFQSSGSFGPGGRDFTINGEGALEVDTIVDIIFEHRDTDGANTVARYIGRRLFEHFAYANPPTSVIDEIIADSAFDTDFLVEAFLRVLFCHDEFYAAAPAADIGTRKSVRWPADVVVGTIRQLGIKPKGKLGEYIIDGGSRRRLRDQLNDMGQLLLEPPTVFGWDLEDGWLSSSTLLARFGFARDVTAARNGGSSSFRPEKVLDLELTDPEVIVDTVLEILQIPDQFSVAERQALVTYLGPGPLNLLDHTYRNTKLHGLFALVLQSPSYQLY